PSDRLRLQDAMHPAHPGTVRLVRPARPGLRATVAPPPVCSPLKPAVQPQPTIAFRLAVPQWRSLLARPPARVNWRQRALRLASTVSWLQLLRDRPMLVFEDAIVISLRPVSVSFVMRLRSRPRQLHHRPARPWRDESIRIGLRRSSLHYWEC